MDNLKIAKKLLLIAKELCSDNLFIPTPPVDVSPMSGTPNYPYQQNVTVPQQPQQLMPSQIQYVQPEPIVFETKTLEEYKKDNKSILINMNTNGVFEVVVQQLNSMKMYDVLYNDNYMSYDEAKKKFIELMGTV